MSDNYQAVFDAVRSKFSTFDSEHLIREISARFDMSFAIEQIKQEYLTTAQMMAEPSVLYKPTLSLDGDMWCALYGENLQLGVAGFGNSPAEAMQDFNKAWNEKLIVKAGV